MFAGEAVDNRLIESLDEFDTENLALAPANHAHPRLKLPYP